MFATTESADSSNFQMTASWNAENIVIDESKTNTNISDGKAALLLIEFLPKKDQEIIRMRYIKELSIQEISNITHQSKNTIAVQIHRSMNKLRVLYRK